MKVRRKITGATEAAGQPEDYPEETYNAANDEEGTGKEDNNTCEHVSGVSSISEEEGRQADSGSMSSRSESKPYSSVTHKCEVRCFCLLEFLHKQLVNILPFLLHDSMLTLHSVVWFFFNNFILYLTSLTFEVLLGIFLFTTCVGLFASSSSSSSR